MKREVECQTKDRRVIDGRGSTPDGGELAPELKKIEFVMLFYDVGDYEHRNAYQMILSPDEAKAYKVGETYTLSIG